MTTKAKPKRSTDLFWGIYNPGGHLVDYAKSRAEARGKVNSNLEYGVGELRVVRVRVTTTPL